ncbi:pilin [Patescibacteria group bacterium]|nr:pilin [Patescibacteria group bacterium]
MVTNPLLPDDTSVIQPKLFFNNVLQTIISLFLIGGVIFFFFHFIQAGFNYIQSRGDPKNLEAVKEQMTNAFVGLAVIFSVFAILKVLGHIFGISSLEQLQIIWPNLL